jgi:hypothetical protein
MGSYGYRSVNCVQCEVEGKCALGANGAATLTDCDSAGGPICDACLRLWLTPSKVSKAEGGSATLSEPVAEVAAPRVEASVTRNTSGISVFFCGRPFSVDWQCLLRYMFEQWRQVSHERIRRADSFRFFFRLRVICRSWWRIAQDSEHVANMAAQRLEYAPPWHALPAASGPASSSQDTWHTPRQERPQQVPGQRPTQRTQQRLSQQPEHR